MDVDGCLLQPTSSTTMITVATPTTPGPSTTTTTGIPAICVAILAWWFPCNCQGHVEDH